MSYLWAEWVIETWYNQWFWLQTHKYYIYRDNKIDMIGDDGIDWYSLKKIVCNNSLVFRVHIYNQHLLHRIWTFNKNIPLTHSLWSKQFVQDKFNGFDQAFLSYLKKWGTQIREPTWTSTIRQVVFFETDYCTMGNIIISCCPSFL